MQNVTKPNQKKLSFLMAFLLCVLAGQSSYADDLEIYQAIFDAQEASDGDAAIDPNVLFVLDNSGSMKDFRLVQTGETTPLGEYDPLINYGGGSRDNRVYLYFTNMTYTGVSMTAAQNDCKAARDAFAATPNLPVHRDKLIQWGRVGSGWGWYISYVNTNNNLESFECEGDNGIHGRTNNSNRKYPKVCSTNQGACFPDNDRAQYERNQQFRSGSEWPYGFFSTERNMVLGNYHQYLLEQAGGGTTVANVDNCTTNGQEQTDSASGTVYTCFQKLEIMKKALTNVIAGDANVPDDTGVFTLNLGLMRFNYDFPENSLNGGTIVDAIAPAGEATSITSDAVTRTNRDDFIDKVEDMQFEGNTPLAESMFEAYQYFAGRAPVSSELTVREGTAFGQDVRDATAVDDDGNFISPVGTNQCQGNYVILLSDGEPTMDADYDTQINSIPDIESCDDFLASDGNTSAGDNCTDELAGALKNNLGVNTYTIGFDRDITLLEEAALKGSPLANPTLGDGYFQADDLNSLESVFTRILSEIETIENDSFVAPAVTVNAFNRLQNREDIYYAVFEPRANPRWPGNIKKYEITSDATIVDSTGSNAINNMTGFFADDTRSIWSDVDDGPTVSLGGFTGELGVPRNLFASLNTGTTTVTPFGTADIDTALSNFATPVAALDSTGKTLGVLNSLTGSIANIAAVINGGAAGSALSANFIDILRWTLGQDIDTDQGGLETDPNKYAGESIHSTPFVLSYGTTDAAPKDVVFMTSNQGLLHAITGQGEDEAGGLAGEVGGSERWAYLPDPDLLKNLGGYYNRELEGSIDHVYGLDGEISFLVERDTTQAVSKAHLFLGQRRGGNKYFGIDVTNGYSTSNPVSKLWTIEGGTGDFARMGQTWAKPVVTALNVCDGVTCVSKDVLVLGGGYDTIYDDKALDVAALADNGGSQNTVGNAIYIVDAETKALLWMTSNTSARVRDSTDDVVVSEMVHSIVSAPTVLDIDKDGNMDTMFAIDVAGQVFRFDFQQDIAGTSVAKSGGLIADLQESSVNRRFYNPVDAVLLPATDDGAQARIALVTGSGYRANPLDAEGSPNRFYVIYDSNLLDPNVNDSGTVIYDYVEGDSGALDNINSGDLPQVTSSTTLEPGTTHKHGYYVNLENTSVEKVINPTLIADFQVIGVSYLPGAASGSDNLCSSAAGSSRAYQLNLLTGETTTTALSKPGVSAAPVLVYILETNIDDGKESLKPVVIIGTEPFKGADFDIGELELGKARKRAWWELDRGIGE